MLFFIWISKTRQTNPPIALIAADCIIVFFADGFLCKKSEIVSCEKKTISDFPEALIQSSDRSSSGRFFQIGISPIVSAGHATFVHELIELAGGKNLAAGAVPYPRFSKEQVLSMMPEIIIITSMARGGRFEEVKAQWNQWSQLPAVKNKRIFIIDSDIVNRPTFRLINGLEALAALIHPEIAE